MMWSDWTSVCEVYRWVVIFSIVISLSTEELKKRIVVIRNYFSYQDCYQQSWSPAYNVSLNRLLEEYLKLLRMEYRERRRIRVKYTSFDEQRRLK